MIYITKGGEKLSGMSAVCTWLVKNRQIARPVTASDLPAIMSGEGITEYIPEPRILTPQERQSALVAAVQSTLDSAAQARGYDGILSVCSYVGDINPEFAADATAFKNYRSAAWTHCNAVLAAVLSGTRPEPTRAELVAELPALVL